ncbi:hypothetical protein B0H16DRAFT_1712444 [Mycena metata]|uniref:Protein kinase domain-containing protein n=1 Tax=Mycena metata TaxID=1033252 RepID=A0AAD7K3G5_9AGAR|nr:hypothetical protein B0H16DRAFT_1712444 [Mycena metata]
MAAVTLRSLLTGGLRITHAPRVILGTPQNSSVLKGKCGWVFRDKTQYRVVYDPTLTDRAMAAWDRTLSAVAEDILESPASIDLLGRARFVDNYARDLIIYTESDIDTFTSILLSSCARLAREVLRPPPEVQYSVQSQTGTDRWVKSDVSLNLVDRTKKPRVEEILDFFPRTLLSFENKLPSVMSKHVGNLGELAAANGGFVIHESLFRDAKFTGAASIVSKICYCMTSQQRPHRIGGLSDGLEMRYLYPRLYPLLLLPILNPDINLTPLTPVPKAVHKDFAHSSNSSSASHPGTVKFSTAPPGFRNTDLVFRPSDPLPPSSPLYSKPVVLHNWTSSSSQTDVMLGRMGDADIVLKMGDPETDVLGRSEEYLWAEADLYMSRLQGLAGVPRLIAKGWIERTFGEWCPALLMESLGQPITEQTLADLCPEDQTQLAGIQRQLKERGVLHADLEPRNIVRSKNGIGLVDFGEITLSV